MRNEQNFVNHSQMLSALLVAVCWGAFFLCPASGQETRTVRKVDGTKVEISTYSEIPEATEPCDPEACQWWKQLRLVANQVQKSGGRKSLEPYINLFAEGLERSFRVPIKDRPAQAIVFARPVETRPLGGPKKNGAVELSVEVRPDGSVGEIKVIKGISADVDKRCVDAIQRYTIYLPAVKDGSFVAEWQSVKFNFWSQGGIAASKQ